MLLYFSPCYYFAVVFGTLCICFPMKFLSFAGCLGQIQWDHPVSQIVTLCTQISLYPLLPLQSNWLDLVVLYYIFNSSSEYGDVLLGTPMLVHAT